MARLPLAGQSAVFTICGCAVPTVRIDADGQNQPPHPDVDRGLRNLLDANPVDDGALESFLAACGNLLEPGAALGPNGITGTPGREALPQRLHRAASQYIAGGYGLIPLHGIEDGQCTCRKEGRCSSPGKHPIRKNWPDRVIRTQDDIDSFWKSRNARPTNIGIFLDPTQRLLLVDVDTKNGKRGLESIAAWSQKLSLDFALYRVQSTPSGGWHCLFRIPESYSTTLPNRSDVAPGIDVLCHNKQFVVSPSSTDKGQYGNGGAQDCVLPRLEDLPEAPRSLLDHLASFGGWNPDVSIAPDLDAIKAPTVGIVREIVKHTPNHADVSYSDYISMAHYIKGACGREHEVEGREIFDEWAGRWEEGDNDPETNNEKFDSIGWDLLRSGWHQLQSFARRHGCNSEILATAATVQAQEEFEAEKDPTKIQALKATAAKAAGWETPIPVSDHDAIEPFPIDALPKMHRKYVQSVASTLEVPVDVPAVNLLGAVAGAAQYSYEAIHVHEDYREPLSLYLLSQLHSGEGKTAVVSEFRRPFERAQEKLRELARPKIATILSKREALESQRKVAEKQLKSASEKLNDLTFCGGEEAEEDRAELTRKTEFLTQRMTQLSADLDAQDIPSEPLIWLTEGTPEAISQHLATQQRLIVNGSEGDLIDVLAGQYTSRGTAKLGPLLSSYSGESYSEARMNGIREVTNPRLTVLLTVQPSVVEKMQQQPEFASRGLTPRFLYSAPRSLVGSRRWDFDARIDRDARIIYESLIGSLLGVNLSDGPVDLSDLTGDPRLLLMVGETEDVEEAVESQPEARPRELSLTEQAFTKYREYRRAIEPALANLEDELSGLAAWGNKLPGQMLRIAGVLHLMEGAECEDERPWNTPISAPTIQCAIAIAEYFRSHTLRLFLHRPLPREALVLEWLQKRDKAVFSPRELFRSVRRQFDGKMATLDEALEHLEEMGWIRPYTLATGGRAARRYEVNPYLWNQHLEVPEDEIEKRRDAVTETP